MDIERAKLAAKRQIGTLRATINYQASHGVVSCEDLDRYYSKMQEEISRAHLVLRLLSTRLEAAGDNPDDGDQVVMLQEVLNTAVIERSKLYERLFCHQKMDSLRAFKQSIVDMIVRGEAPHWISTIPKEDLINHGQEVNRLFQLLVEGQEIHTAGVPLIDSVTLARASERIDLFSLKQCELLRKRSTEVDEFMLKEAERLAESLQEEEDLKAFYTAHSLLSNGTPTPSSSSGLCADGWECMKCTFYNQDSEQDQCIACNTKRAPSFVTVAKRKPQISVNKNAQPAVTGMKEAVLIKKAPARGFSRTNTVWIRNKDVPEMIGPGGKNQRELIKRSGALNIYAYQNRLDNDGMCPIDIQGSLEAFDKVVALLKEKFDRKTSQTIQPKMNSLEEQTKEVVWICNMDVPEMIGEGGKSVQALKAETGVKSITAWQEYVDKDGMCPIHIRGRPNATKKAASKIMNMFCGIPDESRRATSTSASGPPSIGTGPTEKTSTKPENSAVNKVGSSEGIGSVTFPNNIRGVSTDTTPIPSISGEAKTPPVQPLEDFASLTRKPPISPTEVKIASTDASQMKRPLMKPAEGNPALASLSTNQPPAQPAQEPIVLPLKGNTTVVPSLSTKKPAQPVKMMPTVEGSAASETDLHALMLVEGSNNLITSLSKKKPPMQIAESMTASTATSLVRSAPQPKLIISPKTAALKSTLGVYSSVPVERKVDSLFVFLQQHENCLTSPPKKFYDWLQSVQILELEELAEALNDDDFVKLEMKENGLKYFKRFVLQKAISACVKEQAPSIEDSVAEVVPVISESAKTHGLPSPSRFAISQDPPSELVCPIDHVLMVADPVVATDGYTYEREAIESWLQRHPGETVLSPMTHEPLVDTTLTSNWHIRTMARDWCRTNQQG